MDEIILNKDELYNFFNKYDLNEIESFGIILRYVQDYDVTNVMNVLKEVYKEKINEYNYNQDENYIEISDIKEKNNLLNKKELVFLYQITDDAILYLSSIRDYEDEYRAINEDFSYDVEDEIKQISCILDSVNSIIDEEDIEKVKVLTL